MEYSSVTRSRRFPRYRTGLLLRVRDHLVQNL
jgi:hypothetical protein